MKALLAPLACFITLVALWLGWPLASEAQSLTAPLKIAPLLTKPLSELESVLGKPRHIGTQEERYYKVAGFVRVVVRTTPEKALAVVAFQFAPGTVKSELEALRRIGAADAVLPDRWTSHWSTPGDSKNDELTLTREDSTAPSGSVQAKPKPSPLSVTSQNIVLTRHFRERMQERGVSEAQAQDVLQNGQRFYDPKNDSYIRWKDGIYIAHTGDGVLKTVVRGPISKRWQPL